LLLRGFAKFVAVVVAAGLAGAGIGVALAELAGDDSSNDASLPATQPTAARTQTTDSTTPTGTVATSTSPTKPIYRVPRVQVLSAELGQVSESTGRAFATLRVRFTNRGNRPVTIKTPVLLSGEDEVELGSAAHDAAGRLLQPVDPSESATGVLRFRLPSAVAERVTASPGARLRMGNRTVAVRLTSPSSG
jgi:hypothetical protein